MKRKMLAVLTAALCLVGAVPASSVLADGQKVVTLGADLSEDQKQAILRYFGVAGQNLLTLTITNQDERDHLGSYVPLEQIGTRTYSCAFVNPTNSGGIQVKTANLSWVTSNMIASTLSTSGVVNCEVLAAAPFEVSGTGALTGIIMAYESAVGTTLDSQKKEIATQELITTTQIANDIGQMQATDLVNESKIQIIEGQITNVNEIEVVVDTLAQEEQISLSDSDRELLTQLLAEIAQQDYEYEEMKETLERVEQNMQDLSQTNESLSEGNEEEIAGEVVVDGGSSFVDSQPLDSEDIYEMDEEQDVLAQDSILMNTDDSALGGSVIFDATDNAALSDAAASDLPEEDEFYEDIEIVTDDSYSSDEGGELIDDSSSGEVTDVYEFENGTSDDVYADDGMGDTLGEENYTDDGMGDTLGEEIYADDDMGDVLGEELYTDDSELTENPDENAGINTLQLELIPLSEFKFGPITSEASGYEVFAAGQNELMIYSQREDLIAGSGLFTLYNAADSSVIETITMADAEKVAVQPMTEDELAAYGWSAGSKAVVKLADPMPQNVTYFVILSEDALATADGIGHSEVIQDAMTWMIQTGEYGFCLDKPVTGITAGSTVSGQIMMDGTAAAYAYIENADPSMVTFDVSEFTASGTLNATFLQPGTTIFGVSFFDADGNWLDTVDYTAVVK